MAAIACGFVATAQFGSTAGELGFPLDDAWIHLQFASRIAVGDGLAYNPGIWVTGSTSPLWTALVALLVALPGSTLVWMQLLGTAFFLVTVDASGRLAAAMGLDRGATWLARLMVALCYWLVWSALSGMEITLFAALSLWGLTLHVRARRDEAATERPATGSRKRPLDLAALLLFALAALARPEGYLLLVLAVVDRWLPPLMPARHAAQHPTTATRATTAHAVRALEAVLLVAIVVLPTLVFYRAIGGSWLPTTFAVKGATPASLLPDGRYLRVVADIFFRSQPILMLAAGAGVARLASRWNTSDGRGLLPAAWLFGLPLAYAFLTPPGGPPAVGNFGRYYLPLIPILVVVGLYGLAPSMERLARRPRWLGGLLLALLLAPQVAGFVSGRPHYARTVANVLQSDVAAARWLSPRLDPAALIAVQDIGALKYLLPNRVLDLAGIVTPEIVPALRGSNDGTYWEQRLLGFLAGPRPDYLVLFAESYPMIARPAPGFERVATFSVEHNVAMAGETLVIFSTPWTRYPLRDPTTSAESTS